MALTRLANLASRGPTSKEASLGPSVVSSPWIPTVGWLIGALLVATTMMMVVTSPFQNHPVNGASRYSTCTSLSHRSFFPTSSFPSSFLFPPFPFKVPSLSLNLSCVDAKFRFWSTHVLNSRVNRPVSRSTYHTNSLPITSMSHRRRPILDSPGFGPRNAD